MKAKQFRELSAEELEQRQRELVKEHFDLRIKKSAGKLDNPVQLRLIRRDVARAQTILREKSSQQEGARNA